MLSELLIEDICKFIAASIDSAEAVIDEKAIPISILRIDTGKDIVKVFTNANDGKGTITDIRLLDKNKKVLISRPEMIIKDNSFGLVSTFYIRIKEFENANPINIFSVDGKGDA